MMSPCGSVSLPESSCYTGARKPPQIFPAMYHEASYGHPNRIEAELAHSALEAAEIDSMIAADDAGGNRPHLWVAEGVWW
jgi:hypothetical protein